MRGTLFHIFRSGQGKVRFFEVWSHLVVMAADQDGEKQVDQVVLCNAGVHGAEADLVFLSLFLQD